jgi:hypothetical protein
MFIRPLREWTSKKQSSGDEFFRINDSVGVYKASRFVADTLAGSLSDLLVQQ